MKFLAVLFLLVALGLSACSSTPDYKGVYEGAQSTQPLEVPPDLSQPDSDTNASSGLGNVKSYLDYRESISSGEKGKVLHDFKNMHFVRDGALFWLEVSDSEINVWHSMREFWTHLGFKIVSEQPALGLMQTNWKENRVDIPSNWFASLISKLYTSDIMDSYRVHFEYDDVKKLTRVFIAHQGLKEVTEGGIDNPLAHTAVGTKWIRRPSEPDLEVEMLMRFMAFRGMDGTVARQEIAQTKVVEKTVIKQVNDDFVLQYSETFPRAWRLAGIALDRMGVLVEDRNRSAGVYYIKLPDTFELKDESSFFSSSKKPSKDSYLLALEDKGDNTWITVKARGDVGKDLREVSKKILEEIKKNLQ